MRQEVRFTPRQQPAGPAKVYWSEESEHYIGACGACESETDITCDRWAVRRWAVEHSCHEARHGGRPQPQGHPWRKPWRGQAF